MQFYEGSSDGTFETTEDWHIECCVCAEQYIIDRKSLHISVAKHGNISEHYFFGECKCCSCGERLFYRAKVYEYPEGVFYCEEHVCDDVEFVKAPLFKTVKQNEQPDSSNTDKSATVQITKININGGKQMDNLWILTEERPKPSVIKQIIDMYCVDFHDKAQLTGEIKIKPWISNGAFQFVYEVEGLGVKQASKILIKTVSGSSSFLDFLVFKQVTAPVEGSTCDNLIMAIEETKTSDDESRNTGVYQRGSKFVYITPYYGSVKLYMLYNEELEAREEKKPSDTSIFGTNILLTLGVTVVGKDTSKWFSRFKTLDELIRFKAGMRQPPAGNVPITIKKFNDRIEISGRLAKPADAGNIGHDPNIGALSMISKCIRVLGWDKDIVITMHGVSQEYVNRTHGKNKFLYICKILGLRLDGIRMPARVELPEQYWHYEMSSEKMTSILLHVLGMYNGMYGVYENHAGCERGYFRTKQGRLITLPKKDRQGINLYLPDVVLFDTPSNTIFLVEGKKLDTMQNGIEEIQYYDSIENEYIKPEYRGAHILRCVSIFGGERTGYLHKDVLIYMNIRGQIYINPNAPECVKSMFRAVGVRV